MTDRPQTRRVQPAPTMGAQANLICRPMSALSNVTYDGDQRFVGCNRDPDNTLTLRGTDSDGGHEKLPGGGRIAARWRT